LFLDFLLWSFQVLEVNWNVNNCAILSLLVGVFGRAWWSVKHVANGSSNREHNEMAVKKALEESDVLVIFSDIIHDIAHLFVNNIDLGS
jgi:hypothetical protein